MKSYICIGITWLILLSGIASCTIYDDEYISFEYNNTFWKLDKTQNPGTYTLFSKDIKNCVFNIYLQFGTFTSSQQIPILYINETLNQTINILNTIEIKY